MKDIKLHQRSLKYIEDTFKKYHKVNSREELGDFTTRCIIHLYPEADTCLEDGSLNGFIDALDCNAKIFNCATKKYYEYGLVDSISCDIVSNIKVFKDGSTMITIYKPFEMMMGKSIIIMKSE